MGIYDTLIISQRANTQEIEMNKYQVIVKGKRTVEHNIYALDYNKAQVKAIENTIELFPETTVKEWEVIETNLTQKPKRSYRHY
jgi:hypothetical protein